MLQSATQGAELGEYLGVTKLIARRRWLTQQEAPPPA